jgi:hypothetical protein
MIAGDGDTTANPAWGSVHTVGDVSALTEKLDGIVLAAGFEDRAYAALERGRFRPDAHCILIRFVNSITGNRTVFRRYLEIARTRFSEEFIHIVELHHDHPARLEPDLTHQLSRLPRAIRHLGLDLSGLPAYASCMALKTLRAQRAENPLTVIYTAALQYNPSRVEYDELIASSGDEIELLPHAMALEMDQNLQLDSFSGYRSQNAKTCLAILAGFEAHRANGVVEDTNPALLLLLYGKPGDPSLDWRLDLSRRLHRKFERGRRAATETVSTLQFEETVDVLERYYNYLIDDYDVVLAPIGSKMQTLAAYLFWERYGETQLMFPTPIGYDPARSPQGAGITYAVTLEPKSLLFRNSWRAQPSPTRQQREP